MPVDTSAPALRATLQGRYGAYVVDVFGEAAPPAEPVAFTVERDPEIACENPDGETGIGLCAWAAVYTATGNASSVEAVLNAGESRIRVSGPNGYGATFTVWTRPTPATRERAASPRVYRNERVQIETADGLAGLSDADPLNAFFPDVVRDQATRLWLALPGGPFLGPETPSASDEPYAVWASFPVRPSPNPVPADRGLDVRPTYFEDAGNARDPLLDLAELGTLAIYQPSDADPDVPRWEMVARNAVGTAEPVVGLYDDGALGGTAETLPNRTRELPPFTASPRGASDLPALGAVALVAEGGARLAVPALSLGAGETRDFVVGHFDPADGLRFRIALSFPGGAAAGGNDAVFLLTPDDGSGAVAIASTVPTANGDNLTRVTTANPPGPGRVTLRLFGATASGTDRLYQATAVEVVDPFGASVDRFVGAVTGGTGPTAEITRPSTVRGTNAQGDAFDPVLWAHTATGTTHRSAVAAGAAARAAAQAVPLATLDVDLDGLWGPEARFTLTAGPRSPFAASVELVPVSLAPNLKLGTTRAQLVAVSITALS